MIGLEETAHILVDALILLEQFSLVETTIDSATAASIASAITNTKQWVSTFQSWMMTSGVGNNERMQANNHGSWFVSAYSSFAYFTGNATAQALASIMI